MASTEAPVLSDRHGQHIAIFTINRPDARNAINGEVAEAIEAAVNDVEADERLRVAVLTGAGGRVFSDRTRPSFAQGMDSSTTDTRSPSFLLRPRSASR